MNKRQPVHSLQLLPIDNHRLASLCGQFDEHLRIIEQHLHVEIHNRAHHFHLHGLASASQMAEHVIKQLYEETANNKILAPSDIYLFLRKVQATSHLSPGELNMTAISLGHHAPIKPHSPNQELYIKNIHEHDVNFGIGPAGTGKTYLAVACAVAALEKEQISRILLVRPAVEAGEKLGFLPGDLSQKVDPYFRPLYDALYEMMGFDEVGKLIDRHVIEIVPLAYMRGRTLNDSFIILDEGQNTTKEQMKMFLTRIGFNSKVVITGDITQTDLPRQSESGLRHCLDVLREVKGLSFTFFQPSDIVRHPLVQSIIEAYDQHEAKRSK